MQRDSNNLSYFEVEEQGTPIPPEVLQAAEQEMEAAKQDEQIPWPQDLGATANGTHGFHGLHGIV